MGGAEVNFDHPAHLDLDLLEHHLTELQACREVRAPAYDFRTMVQTQEADVIRASSVIVVEGLFVLAAPIVDALDISCFLDVDADQRLLGRILRDHHERGATLAETVDRYQRFVRPSYNVFVAPTRQNADVVVDFTYRRSFFTSLLAELVLEYVSGDLDMQALISRARRDNFRLGYRAEEPIMPISIDIRALAKAFPEHIVQHAPPSAGVPVLFVDTDGHQAVTIDVTDHERGENRRNG
jgi:uridine kinase